MNHNQDPATAIKDLHACFCHETGAQLRLGIGEYNREASWLRFLQAGFTKLDLVAVCRYLRREIREGGRRPGSLKFSNLVEQLDRFEEDLALARAAERNAKPALNQDQRWIANHKPAQKTDAKQIGSYIDKMRKAADGF